MITLDELVRASRLPPSVAPFTLRRLFLRARVFASGSYSPAEVRAALPDIQAELREILSPGEYLAAVRAIDELLAREDRRAGRSA